MVYFKQKENFVEKIPKVALIAMRTIDVGVATFSLTLKSKVSRENEQMSTPLPATALKIPSPKFQ